MQGPHIDDTWTIHCDILATLLYSEKTRLRYLAAVCWHHCNYHRSIYQMSVFFLKCMWSSEKTSKDLQMQNDHQHYDFRFYLILGLIFLFSLLLFALWLLNFIFAVSKEYESLLRERWLVILSIFAVEYFYFLLSILLLFLHSRIFNHQLVNYKLFNLQYAFNLILKY